jgi:hypothetical protein
MPKAVTFTVTTHRRLTKGETGLTTMTNPRLCLGDAITRILLELPDDAYRVVYLDADGNELPDDVQVSDYCRLDIDWTKVPDYIRDPPMRASRR